ncbi:hypothetical protein [Acetobacter vaccinii]|uniref:Uncharacterized protein n=1 Tax=Acetobacter vaccinii TaxID=2592655 RepID=A0A5C1YQR3_9PROT|nr:hypothetical protein [Acetobacter vaccinii]QEO17945.1 hypothetical protein FLP30_09525 [Acetobacter vaccinii]
MPSLDQATQDLAFRTHLLRNDHDGLAFVVAVDGGTDVRPTFFPDYRRTIPSWFERLTCKKAILLIVRQSEEILTILTARWGDFYDS